MFENESPENITIPENWSGKLEHMQVTFGQFWTEPGIRRGKLPLLTYHTRCKMFHAMLLDFCYYVKLG